jgi:hypothetical protein
VVSGYKDRMYRINLTPAWVSNFGYLNMQRLLQHPSTNASLISK